MTLKRKESEVAEMTHWVGFSDVQGGFTNQSRRLYYTIRRICFESMKTVKERMMINNRRALAIPEMENLTGLITKGITEYLFQDTNIEVTLYKTRKEDDREKRIIAKCQPKNPVGTGAM